MIFFTYVLEVDSLMNAFASTEIQVFGSASMMFLTILLFLHL